MKWSKNVKVTRVARGDLALYVWARKQRGKECPRNGIPIFGVARDSFGTVRRAVARPAFASKDTGGR